MAGCASVRSSALSPACSRPARSAGRLRLGRLDRRPRRRAPKTARRRRRATSRPPKAARSRRCSKRPSPAELVVSPAAIGLLQGREPLSLRRLRQGPHARSPTPKSPSTSRRCPKVNLKAEKEGAKGADARAKIKALEEPAIGPFPATVESLATQPAFRAADDQRRPRRGHRRLLDRHRLPQRRRVADRGGDQGRRQADARRCCRASSSARSSACPGWGEKAPLIHTPTPEDVGGDLSKMTTRIPPDTQNQVDYADALGKEPIILLFATPQFCQSRVCGPVVDVAEQVKQLYGDKAAFIHMEIFEDNDPDKGLQPAGAGLPPAERAVAVRDRQGRDDRRGDRGRLRRRRADRSRGKGDRMSRRQESPDKKAPTRTRPPSPIPSCSPPSPPRRGAAAT